MRSGFMTMLTICLVLVPMSARSAEQLSADDMKTAIEMNKIYAQHMYSSTCLERQRLMFVPPILNGQEKAALMASFKKSCDCLTDELLETFSPSDLINYVTYMNGSVAPGKERAKPTAQAAQQNAKIMSFARETQTRKSCGFKQ